MTCECRPWRPGMPHRRPEGPSAGRDSDGMTLIELVMALAVTMTLLSGVPRVIQAVSDASAYAQGTAAGTAQARTAVQDLGYRVQSASQICLPTSMTTVGPTVTSGFAVRVLTDAFGKTHWDQWMVDTSQHVLEEQEWPSTWTTGNAVPSWVPVAQGVVNPTTAPFALPTATVGSPQTLTVDIQVGENFAHRSQTAELKASIAALDTPYSSNPTVTCATASTQMGWT